MDRRADQEHDPGVASARYAGRIVLVTGGDGFIGGHLARALAQEGALVHTTALPGTAALQNSGTAVRHEVDLRAEADVSELIATVRPNVVFHLAGHVDTASTTDMVGPTLQGNLVTTVNVLLGALGAGARRVVTTGSSEEISALTESPSSPYAASKHALSAYIPLFRDLYGMDVVSVRPFMAYGPGQPPRRLIPGTVLRLLAGSPVEIRDGSRMCDFVYVDDVVEGLVLAGLEGGLGDDAYDLGTGTGQSIHSVVERLRELIPSAPEVHYREGSCAVGAHVAFVHGSRLPNWAPAVSLDEGLARTVEWFRTHRDIPEETT